jgi:UPF0176 protein
VRRKIRLLGDFELLKWQKIRHIGPAVSILNISFYKFVALEGDFAPTLLREPLRALAERFGLRGTIILSPFGINSFLAGDEPEVRAFVQELAQIAPFAGIVPKESYSENVPSKRLKVKLKKELIPSGLPVGTVNPIKATGKRIMPRELKAWLDQGKDFVLLDTRNQFEIEVGTFENALNIGVQRFRYFPKLLEQAKETMKDKPVVMFCTGGIRCEVATAVAMEQGLNDVYQLEGGILKYFEECGGAHYNGNCFVFDERRSVDPSLTPRPL